MVQVKFLMPHLGAYISQIQRLSTVKQHWLKQNEGLQESIFTWNLVAKSIMKKRKNLIEKIINLKKGFEDIFVQKY